MGCSCGPDLYSLAEKFLCAEIRGIDFSSVAVAKGNECFTQEGISNVKLLAGKAGDLRRSQDKSFDVVLTDAVLKYV